MTSPEQRHADQVAAAMAALPGRPLDPDSVPLLADWRAQSQECEAGCPHIGSSGPWVGLLYAPGVVWCASCAATMDAAHIDVYGPRCAACEAPTTARLAWRAAPALAVFGRLCANCTNTTQPDTEGDNTE